MEESRVAGLDRAAEVALRTCLRVNRSEDVLVVTDEPCRTVGLALWDKACELGCEAVLVEIKPRGTHGEEPPATVAQAMKAAKVCLLVTSKSLSHTHARREACAAGSRIASLPGITPDIMDRTVAADYQEIAAFTLKVAAKLAGARRAGRSTRTRVSTPHPGLSATSRLVKSTWLPWKARPQAWW